MSQSQIPMPDNDDNPLNLWKHFAGVFRFGKGLLGRTSIAFIGLLVLGISAIWRLHSDLLILAVFIIGATIFLIWYFRVERFANRHPLEALLEGGEYTAHHQMLLAAKGQPVMSAASQSQNATAGITQASAAKNDGEALG